jgi:hypothetical protein
LRLLPASRSSTAGLNDRFKLCEGPGLAADGKDDRSPSCPAWFTEGFATRDLKT